MYFFDSHCHLDDPRFDPVREGVLRRARERGVRELLIPGVSASTWERTRDCCAATAGIYRAYGLHPYFLAEHREEDLAALEVWLDREKPVALGECGLDFHRPDLDPARQTALFRAQLSMAKDFGLPVIVHARKALDRVTAELRKFSGPGGVIHSFAGSEQQAARLLDLGFRLGIGANIQYTRAQRLRRVVASIPLEGLLTETDAPDQPGPNQRGRLNEPAYVADVAAEIAALRGLETRELAEITAANARQLFGLDRGALDV